MKLSKIFFATVLACAMVQSANAEKVLLSTDQSKQFGEIKLSLDTDSIQKPQNGELGKFNLLAEAKGYQQATIYNTIDCKNNSIINVKIESLDGKLYNNLNTKLASVSSDDDKIISEIKKRICD